MNPMKPPASVRALLDEAMAHVTTVDPAEAQRLRAEGALMVDLREIGELAREGAIPGAKHIPRGLLEFRADPECDYHDAAFDRRDRPCVLYCAIGWRSALAAQTLQGMGYTHVVNLGGGFEAWKAQGLPVESWTTPPP